MKVKRFLEVEWAKPCMAITLVNPARPNEAGSYLWCKLSEHNGPHLSYCGTMWMTADLVEPTPEMILWRTGNEDEVKAVTGRMLG